MFSDRCLKDFYGQGVQPLIDKILQCIIHKPMARHAALAHEGGAVNTNPEVGAPALIVGTRMASMRCAFINHLQLRGMKPVYQLPLQRGGLHRQRRAHGVGPGLMCLFRYTA